MKLVEAHGKKVIPKPKGRFVLHLMSNGSDDGHVVEHRYENSGTVHRFEFRHPEQNLDLLKHLIEHGDLAIELGEPSEGHHGDDGYMSEEG